MKILVSALETSSNIHLKALKKELNPKCELVGIFDKNLGNAKYDISHLAIMGFIDVIKKLPFFLKLKKEMINLAKDVDKVLLMDSSGFNIPLAKSIKKKYPNKEIIYYILPQAWAWKKKRIPLLEKTCDKLCSILPFEQNLYTNKTKISYVGHPLLDEIKEFKQEVNRNSNTIVFMPGSRKTEIINHMKIFNKLKNKFKDRRLVLIIPEKFTQDYIKKVYKDTSGFIISSNTYEELKKAQFAFICSGTATLEAALIGTPFILCYIAKKLDYFIGTKVIKLPYIGLANIFFHKLNKKPIHKEFLQENVTVENLFNEYTSMNEKLFLENSKILRKYLKSGSSKNVANIIHN